MGDVEDVACFAQALEECCRPSTGPSLTHSLAASHDASALGQLIGAQQVAANGSGEHLRRDNRRLRKDAGKEPPHWMLARALQHGESITNDRPAPSVRRCNAGRRLAPEPARHRALPSPRRLTTV